MELVKKERKERVTVNLDESNLLILKRLKINYQDDYSFVVNNLLTKYRNDHTKDMTDFEKA